MAEHDILDFDHHREERHRSMSEWEHARSSSADRAHGDADHGERVDRERAALPDGGARHGSPRNFSHGSHEWRVPGPFAGRGPCGFQRSDDRIREELSDRLTAHGFIDATGIECRVQNGEVTLTGFVDSRGAKRAAEDVADGIQGVHDVCNNLRIRSHADAERAGRAAAYPLTDPRPRSRTSTAGDRRSRERTR
jgi:hypothetical protein